MSSSVVEPASETEGLLTGVSPNQTAEPLGAVTTDDDLAQAYSAASDIPSTSSWFARHWLVLTLLSLALMAAAAMSVNQGDPTGVDMTSHTPYWTPSSATTMLETMEKVKDELTETVKNWSPPAFVNELMWGAKQTAPGPSTMFHLPVTGFSLLLLEQPAVGTDQAVNVQQVNTSEIDALFITPSEAASDSSHSHSDANSSSDFGSFFFPPPAAPLVPLSSITCACMRNQSTSQGGAVQFLVLLMDPAVLRSVAPHHADRILLLSRLREASAGLCTPLLAYVWMPAAFTVKKLDGAIDEAAVYLHALLHELPSFVDRLLAADSIEALLLARTFHVPPDHLTLLTSVRSINSILTMNHSTTAYTSAATTLLSNLLPLATQPSIGPSTTSNYSLTAFSLQQRYVEAVRASMEAPADCYDGDSGRSQQAIVDSRDLLWNEANDAVWTG